MGFQRQQEVRSTSHANQLFTTADAVVTQRPSYLCVLLTGQMPRGGAEVTTTVTSDLHWAWDGLDSVSVALSQNFALLSILFP